MNKPDLSVLPGILLDNDEPVFDAPWQAQAFAMVVSLHQKGLFTWSEWAQALSQELKDDDDASNYYHHWLRALEKLTVAKGATTEPALNQREQAWHEAAARTPHGKAIRL